jgi:hypothetical protein
MHRLYQSLARVLQSLSAARDKVKRRPVELAVRRLFVKMLHLQPDKTLVWGFAKTQNGPQ